MNEALARRVFLAVVVTCLFTFGLAGAIAVQGLGDLDTVSGGNVDTVSTAAQPQVTTASQVDQKPLAQQQLSAVDSDIASSTADLAQAAAAAGPPKDK